MLLDAEVLVFEKKLPLYETFTKNNWLMKSGRRQMKVYLINCWRLASETV